MKNFNIDEYLINSKQKLNNYKELFNSEIRTQKEIHDFNGYYSITFSSCVIIERFIKLNKKEEIEKWKLTLNKYLLKMKKILEKK